MFESHDQHYFLAPPVCTHPHPPLYPHTIYSEYGSDHLMLMVEFSVFDQAQNVAAEPQAGTAEPSRPPTSEEK